MVVLHPWASLVLAVIFPMGLTILQGIPITSQQLGAGSHQKWSPLGYKTGRFRPAAQRFIVQVPVRKPLDKEMSAQATKKHDDASGQGRKQRNRTSESIIADEAMRNAGHVPNENIPLVFVRKYAPWDEDDKVQKMAQKIYGYAHTSLVVGEFQHDRGFVGTEWDVRAEAAPGGHNGVPLKISKSPFLKTRSYPSSQGSRLEFLGKLKTRPGYIWGR